MAAMSADRNLLFGLLALQNGLIDQDQLVAAFRAWSRDKGRPIADYLVNRGDLDADQRSVVQAMVAVHEKKHGGSTVLRGSSRDFCTKTRPMQSRSSLSRSACDRPQRY